MLRMAILVLASICAEIAWAVLLKDRAFLSTDMQPAVVAKTLSHVEDEWKATARTFIKCELGESKEDTIRDCDDTPSDFSKSCSTVVGAVVQGSSGDPSTMREYMGKVCNQDTMASWHQTSCLALANSIGAKMGLSAYDNRVNFETSAACDDFWSNFLAEQKELHKKEISAMKEQEKKDVEVAAQESKKAEERSKKAQKDLEEAEHGDTAKEEAELDAERKMVALRANRTADTGDKIFKQQEAKVKAVEEAAEKQIAEATKLEEEPLTPSIKEAATLTGDHAAKPLKKTAADATYRRNKQPFDRSQMLTKLATKDSLKKVQPTIAAIGKKGSTATKGSTQKLAGVAQAPKKVQLHPKK